MRVVGGKGGDGCVSFIKYVREAHLVHTKCATVCHQFNNSAEMFTAAHNSIKRAYSHHLYLLAATGVTVWQENPVMTM